MVRFKYATLSEGWSNTKVLSCFTNIKNLSRILVFVMGVCSGGIFSVTFFSALRYSRSLARGGHPHYRLDPIPQLQTYSQGDLRKTHSKNETFHKDSALPVVKLPAGGNTLENWALMKSALRYIHDRNYLETHDWVLRVTDKTFVVVENLRYLLLGYQPAEALYLGCRFKKFIKRGFMSGGAGYVLSRQAVTRVVEDGLTSGLCNPKDGGTEDLEMGYCMEALNVTIVDTRDQLGRGRFFPLSLEDHITPGSIKPDHWYWDMIYYPPETGFNCCSDTAISFFGISHQRMYVLNYFVYHLRPYGITSIEPMNETFVDIKII